MAEPEVLPESTPTPEPEPEGVIDVQGRKMVPVDALIAARKTAAENAEQKVRAEYEPWEAWLTGACGYSRWEWRTSSWRPVRC